MQKKDNCKNCAEYGSEFCKDCLEEQKKTVEKNKKNT